MTREAYIALSVALDECDETDSRVEFTIDRQTRKVTAVEASSMSWQALRASLKAANQLRVVN